MRVSLRRSSLALLASVGMLLQLGVGVCGSLLCGDQGSALCCSSQGAEPDDHPSAPTVQRAPCGCCDTQATCSTAPAGPVLEAALAELPAPPSVALPVQPVALRPQAAPRLTASRWQARPPPALPSPTATIVLLI